VLLDFASSMSQQQSGRKRAAGSSAGGEDVTVTLLRSCGMRDEVNNGIDSFICNIWTLPEILTFPLSFFGFLRWIVISQ
jgi:hypothetical protein